MKQLNDLKNVGKATLEDLHLLGIHSVEQLSNKDPTDLFDELERLTQVRQDPCVWDIFAAIIHEASTGVPTAWWEWTHKRKSLQKGKKYTYKPYSNTFPSLFQKEKERISSSLNIASAIEHVGSTSIPGLGGKGIIDIVISVPREEMDQASQILQELGYEYRPSFSTLERFYFVSYLEDLEEGIRRYHIHLTYPSSKEWKNLIGFRDYLRTHPEAVEEYAAIKKHAAAVANQDGEQYRKMKEPIFKKINAFINRPLA